MTPLPQRILQVLSAHGPSYAAALADELDAPDSAVSQALGSLARRGLVRRDGRDGRRVMFSAVAGARPRVPLWGLPARIWQHLATNGPSYASMIARELDVSDPGLVGTALRSLQRRGYVARAGLADVGRFTAGKPVLWAALDHPGAQGRPVDTVCGVGPVAASPLRTPSAADEGEDLTPLMSRVLQALNEHGPSHAVELADKLGVRDIRTSEALASLDRLGLITRDSRGGQRVIYRARTPDPRPTLPRGLPTRVWQHLATFGPSCAPALADDLGVREQSHVNGALKRLQRCGRAEPAGRASKLEGTRARPPILFAALDEHGDRVEPEVDVREREPRAHERHGDGRYSAMDIDIALSRAADPDVEIEALMIGNRPFV